MGLMRLDWESGKTSRPDKEADLRWHH